MNILILKDHHEYYRAHGHRLFHAYFAGYWEDGLFLIRKDRFMGKHGRKLNSEELVNYINEMQEGWVV